MKNELTFNEQTAYAAGVGKLIYSAESLTAVYNCRLIIVGGSKMQNRLILKKRMKRK